MKILSLLLTFVAISTSAQVAVRYDTLGQLTNYSVKVGTFLTQTNTDNLTNSGVFIGHGGIQMQVGWYGQNFPGTDNDNPRNGIEFLPTGPFTPLAANDYTSVPQAFIHVLRNWGGASTYDRPTLHFASKGDIRIEPAYSSFSSPIPADYYGLAYISIGNEDAPHVIRINEVRGSIYNHGTGSIGDEYSSIKANQQGYGIPVTFYSSFSRSSAELVSTPSIQGLGALPGSDNNRGKLRFLSERPEFDLYQPTVGEQNPNGFEVALMDTNHFVFHQGGIKTDRIGAETAGGLITVTNSLIVGLGDGTTDMKIINNTRVVANPASYLSHFIQLYYNGSVNDHGIGVAVFPEGTADYIMSDNNIVMAQSGAPATAQVIFNVDSTPTNTFKGGVYSPQFRSQVGNAPASATAAGTAGEIRWDTGFIYICTAANTWKRVAIATW